jgi:Pregnancy-associated plasma protein-A
VRIGFSSRTFRCLADRHKSFASTLFKARIMFKPLRAFVICAFLLLGQACAHAGHGIHSFEDEYDLSSNEHDRHLQGDDGEPLVQDIELWDRRGRKHKGVRCAFRQSKRNQKRMLREQDVRLLQIPASPVNIAVKIHVIAHPLGMGNVTDAQIMSQMSTLNQTYNSSMFTFTLDPATDIIRRVNSTMYTDCYSKRDVMKQAWGFDVANYMSVYLCKPAGGVLGHSSFPNSYVQTDKRHGVVVHFETLPGGPATNFSKGYTMTHEVGHYLGLLHTFQGGCAASGTAGDRVPDTPAEGTATYGCPTTPKDTCTNLTGLDVSPKMPTRVSVLDSNLFRRYLTAALPSIFSHWQRRTSP